MVKEIVVKNVYKNFKDIEVLKNINLTLSSGKITGIVGHNGSGKTVLFKCICGFYKVTKGQILVDNKEMGKDIDMLNNSGIIIEEPGFLQNWNGFNNLEILYVIKHKRNKEAIKDIMTKVGLDYKMKRPVGKYSLGMRQRLAIAQAIMDDPDVLILDEPMNGLDKNGVKEMREVFLEEKNKGKVILMASHNREDIEVLCDEVFEMENGVLTKIK